MWVPDFGLGAICQLETTQPTLNLDGLDIVEADLTSTRDDLIFEVVQVSADGGCRTSNVRVSQFVELEVSPSVSHGQLSGV